MIRRFREHAAESGDDGGSVRGGIDGEEEPGGGAIDNGGEERVSIEAAVDGDDPADAGEGESETELDAGKGELHADDGDEGKRAADRQLQQADRFDGEKRGD